MLFRSNFGRMCVKLISSSFIFTITSHKESLSSIRLFCPRVCTPDDAGGDEEAPRIVVSLRLFLKFLWGKNGFTKKRYESVCDVTTTTTTSKQAWPSSLSPREKQLVVSSFFQPNDAWEAKEKEEEGGGKAEVVPD